MSGVSLSLSLGKSGKYVLHSSHMGSSVVTDPI